MCSWNRMIYGFREDLFILLDTRMNKKVSHILIFIKIACLNVFYHVIYMQNVLLSIQEV